MLDSIQIAKLLLGNLKQPVLCFLSDAQLSACGGSPGSELL
jgi:hypothetical protein